MSKLTKTYLEQYPNNKKHTFYNNIYSVLNNNYDSETRIYNKKCENYDFLFKDNKLSYLKDDEFKIDEARKLFNNLKEKDINPNARPIQQRISYYQTNRLIPVIKIKLIINF